MAWRIVRQPDGKLARFDDPVDNFTYYDLTEEQAYEMCREKMGIEEAKRKVQSGVDDIQPWTTTKKGDGLSRWNDCLSSIVMQHGYDELKKTLEEMKLLEYLPSKEHFKDYLREDKKA